MAITAAKTGSIGGIIKWFQFTSIADTDTFVGPKTGAYWAQAIFNPTTQGSAGINVVRTADSTTYTFYPGETGAGYLFVENTLP